MQRIGRRRAHAHLLMVAALFVGLPSAAIAETSAAESESGGLAALGLRGVLVGKNFSHFRESNGDDQNFRNEVLLQIEWSRRLVAWADARLVVDVGGDDGGLAKGLTFRIPETEAHRSIVAVKEATLTGRAGPVEVSLGKQIYAWGTADAWNPTDNLNPYDYLDPIDSGKIGVWSMSARATVGPGSVTFVVVPVFTPSRLPLPDSRWVPPPPAGVVVESRDLPGRGAADIEYAARAKVTLRGWDLSLSYFDGFDHVPVVRRSEVASMPGAVRLTPIFSRVRAAGADVSTTFGKLVVYGEVAAKFVTRNAPYDRLHSIVGGNYSWDSLGLRWLDQVTLIAEYARETVLGSASTSDVVDPASLNPFRDAFVSRLQFKFTEDTQLKFTAVLNLVRQPSHLLQVKASHKVTDTIHLEAGLDFFAGSRDTFYGRWKDNDRFFFSAKYYF